MDRNWGREKISMRSSGSLLEDPWETEKKRKKKKNASVRVCEKNVGGTRVIILSCWNCPWAFYSITFLSSTFWEIGVFFVFFFLVLYVQMRCCSLRGVIFTCHVAFYWTEKTTGACGCGTCGVYWNSWNKTFYVPCKFLRF